MSFSSAILRREFFAILGACAASAEGLLDHHSAAAAAIDFAAYRPRALSPSEYELLDVFAETLLPADETGPGAHAAHVVYYIDVVLTHGPATRLESWKSGLAQIDKLAEEGSGQRFALSSQSQRDALLAKLAKNEMNPENEQDTFFVDAKRTIVEGFYASELIQREHLGYRGNTAIAEFPGCTHPNFEHPDPA